jgi:hypothetical protein
VAALVAMQPACQLLLWLWLLLPRVLLAVVKLTH